MIKKKFVCSPSPCGNSLSVEQALTPVRKYKATVSFGFALLFLALSISNISAQTRAKRVASEPDENSTANAQEGSDAAESGTRNKSQMQVVPPSQVRKTALTYPTRTGSSSADRPALVNDIVIISRADESGAARRQTARKTSNIPSIWPVVGALRSGVGVRSNPFGGSSLEYHKGQDISAPTGTPIRVTADGVVVIAGWVKGYGNGIYVDHGNGITTRYGHLSRIDVVVGQTLRQGEQIGLVGSTGRSTGPHLHYEVRVNGQPTSPILYMPSVPTLQEAVGPSSPAKGARQ